MPSSAKGPDHIGGLDSIRFLCALWVFLGHGAAPALVNPFEPGTLAHLALRGLYGNLWVGPAAVIIFFVISGFCIHYPYAGSGKRPVLGEFYTRRMIRLLIPVAIAIPLGQACGVRLSLFQDSILWSLVAELIYYLVYPVLRLLQLRFGSWNRLLAGAFVAGIVVAATNPAAGNYPSYGTGLNWVLGLPCWLLGCMVAEQVRAGKLPGGSLKQVWGWRTAILGAAMGCSVLRFHSPVGFPWTLNVFAMLVAFWLLREIASRRQAVALRTLEWAGSWSYSLYLMHVPAGAWFGRLMPAQGEVPCRWALEIGFVLLLCYLFYLAVEWPSHFLARKVARQLRP